MRGEGKNETLYDATSWQVAFTSSPLMYIHFTFDVCDVCEKMKRLISTLYNMYQECKCVRHV